MPGSEFEPRHLLHLQDIRPGVLFFICEKAPRPRGMWYDKAVPGTQIPTSVSERAGKGRCSPLSLIHI